VPNENEYSISDLANLAGVTPRAIRYYVTMGLLPSPGQTGPGARYNDGHLARLRLIKQLQREHFPLADIRSGLAELTDDQVAEMLEAPGTNQPPTSAKDYIRDVLGDAAEPGTPPPSPLLAQWLGVRRSVSWMSTGPDTDQRTEPRTPDRSQWDRVVLGPDIELHVRRPLSRHQHRQVEKLIAIARQVLEEE
jgi:DNA-binding transcriptional MerR regulator